MEIRLREDVKSCKREGTERPRAYYIPFSSQKEFAFKDGILDRSKSDRFISLDGVWRIREYPSPEQVDIDKPPKDKIPVPACVQMHGYDHIQYINCRYPFPFDPPVVPKDNPTYHYQTKFNIENTKDKYYLNFEGVDSYFVVYVNKMPIGNGQISHATNEFDITHLLVEGENTLDVVVVKWSFASYFECQDKFRWTGIFRSVYILRRPKEHIRDFKVTTDVKKTDGIVTIQNLSDIPIRYALLKNTGVIEPNKKAKIVIENAKIWSSENPNLYDLVLSANGEKILQRVGIRSVKIDKGIFKINGEHIKLKGVNRHESNPYTAAVVTIQDIIKDLELMKWAGVNAIRTSHYPNMPEFYELVNARGFYIMDEADLETHGICQSRGGYENAVWQEWAEKEMFSEPILDREINLYERDKNFSCIIMWSLGNESSYGKAFYAGADYIKKMDDRPIHYEGLMATDMKEYYTKRVDVASRMYAPPSFLLEYLEDEKETRPLVLCEYSHAMGNSNGDLNDYWKIIDSNDRFMGAYVWEWCEHAVWSEQKKGFLYGGDFGEAEHDGNFCVDGLVTPDRRVQSNLRELKAIYDGKREFEPLKIACKLQAKKEGKPCVVKVAENGVIEKLGNIPLKTPIKIDVFRAPIDNDRGIKGLWERLAKPEHVIDSVTEVGNKTIYKGRLVKNTFKPILRFQMTVEPFANGIDLELSYEVGEYIDYLARVGFSFSLNKKFQKFTYSGYGPYESYIDKHIASEYGEYSSTAIDNFNNYVMPQENGSHFGTSKLIVDKAFTVTAKKPFSFSVLPYSREQLTTAEHSFELGDSDATYVHIDLAMSGVGTTACGPALDEKYRVSKKGTNKFRITF